MECQNIDFQVYPRIDFNFESVRVFEDTNETFLVGNMVVDDFFNLNKSQGIRMENNVG